MMNETAKLILVNAAAFVISTLVLRYIFSIK